MSLWVTQLPHLFDLPSCLVPILCIFSCQFEIDSFWIAHSALLGNSWMVSCLQKTKYVKILQWWCAMQQHYFCRRLMESHLQMPMQRSHWRMPSLCWMSISTTLTQRSKTYRWQLRWYLLFHYIIFTVTSLRVVLQFLQHALCAVRDDLTVPKILWVLIFSVLYVMSEWVYFQLDIHNRSFPR